jgi:hypothetical protein
MRENDQLFSFKKMISMKEEQERRGQQWALSQHG